MTLRPGRVPRTTGSDQAQLLSRAEAGGPGSGVQSPNSTDGKHPGLGKPREQRGGASFTQGAAATVTGRDATERDPGRDSKQATQAPPRPGPPHLWGAPRRLRRCRRHLRCLSHRFPPAAPQAPGPGSAPGRAGLQEPRLRGRGVFPAPPEDAGEASAASWNQRRPLSPSQPQPGPGDPAVCARSRGGAAGGWAP